MKSGTPVSRAWSWRHAVTKSDLSPTTRHVLLTLSVFMDGAGQSCFPSIEDIIAATGLSNRAVLTHIEKACLDGWLTRKPHGFRGQRWRRLEYEAGWPGREVDTPSGEADDQPQEGSEPGSPRPEKAVNVGSEGGERPSPEAVNEVHRGKDHSIHQSKTSPIAVADARDHDALDAALRDAAADSLNAVSTGLMVHSIPLRWLSADCSLDLDILPTLRAVGARLKPGSVRSWAYFDGAVIEARDQRLAPIRGSPESKANGTTTVLPPPPKERFHAPRAPTQAERSADSFRRLSERTSRS